MSATSSAIRDEIRQREAEPASLLSRVGVWLALAAATGLGAVLQLHAITAKSFWLDEGSSITMARLDWFNFVRILWRREMNMVLYYLLLRGWLHLGDSVAWIRGLSVVFAVVAIPAIFLLGRKMLGTRFGLVSALLLSVNAFQVRYAQEARTYSLLVLLLIIANYFFISAIDSGRRRDWNWYIVASSLAIYAHFFAVLVVVAHWVALRVMVQTGVIDASTEIRAQFRRAARLVALWTAPIWIFIATTGAGPIAWIPRPGLGDIIGLLKKLSGNAGHHADDFVRGLRVCRLDGWNYFYKAEGYRWSDLYCSGLLVIRTFDYRAAGVSSSAGICSTVSDDFASGVDHAGSCGHNCQPVAPNSWDADCGGRSVLSWRSPGILQGRLRHWP